MESEDLSFIAFLCLAVLMLGGLSFYAGKYFEDRRWKALIPGQFEQLCSECAGIDTSLVKGNLNADN